MTSRTKILLGAGALIGIVGFLLWRTTRLKSGTIRGYDQAAPSPSTWIREGEGSGKSYPKGSKKQAMSQFVEKAPFAQRTVLHRDPGYTAGPSIGGASDVWELFKGQGLLPQEEMLSICLDGRNRIAGVSVAHRGDPTGVHVNPADTLRPCVIAGSPRVVIAHNHPSGEAVPSSEDITVTKRMAEAGKTVGVQLLDHIVLAEKGYASLRDLGYM